MKRMLDINGSYPLQVIIDDLCDALNGGGNSEVKIVAWGQQVSHLLLLLLLQVPTCQHSARPATSCLQHSLHLHQHPVAHVDAPSVKHGCL